MTAAFPPDQALSATVAAFIDQHRLLPAGPVVVAFSGGPDSLILLHLLADLAPVHGWRLIAAHLDHGLRPDSAAEVAVVQRLAAARALPLLSERVDGPALAAATGQGIEASARAARYRFLAAVAARHGGAPVATGHTRDDQAETLLLHLERGSGLSGLVGMRPAIELPASTWGGTATEPPLRVVRPLLAVARQTIQDEVTRRGLTPLADSSNATTIYRRNRLRHQLLSVWEQLTPGIGARLARTAALLAADEDYLTTLTEEHWRSLGAHHGPGASLSFERAAFLARPLALQRRLLRHALQQLGGLTATAAAIEAALPLIADRTGARVDLVQTVRLTVEPTRLRLVDRRFGTDAVWPERPWMTAEASIPLTVGTTTMLPGRVWALTSRLIAADACQRPLDERWHVHLSAALTTMPLRLRTWQAGDRIALANGRGHKKLGDLFIDAKRPRAERPTVPLLVGGDEIVWAIGQAASGRWRADTANQIILCATIHRYDQ